MSVREPLSLDGGEANVLVTVRREGEQGVARFSLTEGMQRQH